MIIVSAVPLLAIAVSAASAVLIFLARRSPSLRESVTFAAAFLKFGLIASLYPAVSAGGTVAFRLAEWIPGAPLSLRVDALGLTFAVLSSGLWIVTSVYSLGYMRALREHAQTRYFASFALSLSAAVGIAFAGDLITFFIFYEMLTLSTWPLVAHKESAEALKAGRKYLVYSLSAGALLLTAIVWTWLSTGSTAFAPGGFIDGRFHGSALALVFFLFIAGCAVKASLFPVHAWLPSAMAAPVPVSALLHAVAVVKAGVFGILRITGYVFGPEVLQSSAIHQPLCALAAFTVIAASLIALVQDNFKRRLAYSTISQLACIVLGTALLTAGGFKGAILHLANHAFLKITLFFTAGIIYVQAHRENVSDFRGLGRKMPLPFILFALAAAGLAGFPPLAGFISKWHLCLGSADSFERLYMGVFLFSSLLNIAYFFPVIQSAFSEPKVGHSVPEIQDNNWLLLAPACLTAALGLAFGCVPLLMKAQSGLADQAVQAVFGG
ncbi:MAG: monovalent cation/H+ antiporter subunit D family protein [Candidatus Omnitrophica bacterium]|nr:monovalent cation/H+ antiporter subunit D family protein [Candidatus Omnitrophota bacterium]